MDLFGSPHIPAALRRPRGIQGSPLKNTVESNKQEELTRSAEKRARFKGGFSKWENFNSLLNPARQLDFGLLMSQPAPAILAVEPAEKKQKRKSGLIDKSPNVQPAVEDPQKQPEKHTKTKQPEPVQTEEESKVDKSQKRPRTISKKVATPPILAEAENTAEEKAREPASKQRDAFKLVKVNSEPKQNQIEPSKPSKQRKRSISVSKAIDTIEAPIEKPMNKPTKAKKKPTTAELKSAKEQEEEKTVANPVEEDGSEDELSLIIPLPKKSVNKTSKTTIKESAPEPPKKKKPAKSKSKPASISVPVVEALDESEDELLLEGNSFDAPIQKPKLKPSKIKAVPTQGVKRRKAEIPTPLGEDEDDFDSFFSQIPAKRTQNRATLVTHNNPPARQNKMDKGPEPRKKSRKKAVETPVVPVEEVEIEVIEPPKKIRKKVFKETSNPEDLQPPQTVESKVNKRASKKDISMHPEPEQPEANEPDDVLPLVPEKVPPSPKGKGKKPFRKDFLLQMQIEVEVSDDELLSNPHKSRSKKTSNPTDPQIAELETASMDPNLEFQETPFSDKKVKSRPRLTEQDEIGLSPKRTKSLKKKNNLMKKESEEKAAHAPARKTSKSRSQKAAEESEDVHSIAKATKKASVKKPTEKPEVEVVGKPKRVPKIKLPTITSLDEEEDPFLIPIKPTTIKRKIKLLASTRKQITS